MFVLLQCLCEGLLIPDLIAKQFDICHCFVDFECFCKNFCSSIIDLIARQANPRHGLVHFEGF